MSALHARYGIWPRRDEINVFGVLARADESAADMAAAA